MYTKEELEKVREQAKKESAYLLLCPFCGCKAEFSINKSEQIMLNHFPDSGVICPARCEIYCDTFVFGSQLWNKQAERHK